MTRAERRRKEKQARKAVEQHPSLATLSRTERRAGAAAIAKSVRGQIGERTA